METPQDKPPRWAGLGTRVISAIPLLAVVILCVWAGGFFFAALVLLSALIMLKEWETLTSHSGMVRMLGYPLIALPCASLLWLRYLRADAAGELGMLLVFSLIAMIAATDIGAYFVGRRFGHFKLAPTLSPNKTWEGLAGGMLSALIVGALVLPVWLPLSVRIGIGMVIALLAQTGDILESAVKRRAGVKDSGMLIPGHGGLLDRLDGYLLSAPVFALVIHYAGMQ